eukprot:scaffold1525_cov142-Cylindrotheca_fusiformis.AAC.151
MQKAGNSASSEGYQSLFSSMKGVSSGCSLPLDQPLLTPPCLRVARLCTFRETSATRLARANPRVNRLRRFPRVCRPLRPRLARG